MTSYHNQAIAYRPEIDGLRAIAVLPVILFHAGFELFSGGYVGVDVFFVISGYLITSIILREMEQGKFSIVRFYERRARRILPALFFVIACCLPFAWMWMLPDELKRFGQSLVAVATFSSNIYFWRTTDYFASAAEEQPLLHTWSLAVEEQYYVLFPLFLMLCWRFGKSRVFLLTAVVAICSLLLAEWAWRNQPVANFYLLPTRAWELLAGSLLAFIPRDSAESAKTHKSAQVYSAAGLLMIFYSVLFFDSDTPFPSVYTFVPVFGTVLLIIYASQTGLVGSLLTSKHTVGVGLISYSAYLWHQPIFTFTRLTKLEHPSQVEALIAVIASLLLAWITYRYVESPFRGAQVTRKKVLTSASIALLAISLFGFLSLNGLRNIFYNPLNGLGNIVATAEANPRRPECHKNDKSNLEPSIFCKYPETSNPKIAVFGDSHGVEPAEALGEVLGHEGGVAAFTFSGCGPFSPSNDKYSSGCQTWSRNTQRYIADQNGFTTVLVMYRLYSHVCGSHEGSYPKIPLKCNFHELDELAETLRFFSEKGKKVYLVLQVPEVKTHIKSLVVRSEPQAAGRWQSVSREWWELRKGPTLQYLTKLDLGDAVVIDPTPLFCDVKHCYATDNVGALYFDDDHLSRNGAKKLADSISSKFQ